MGVQDQRPRFYEGQYLGAEDLAAIVDYGSMQLAREMLGGHTPGISIGLDLLERPIGGGPQRDVILQPGYAWDGFGRPIVALAPYVLPRSLFEAIPPNPAVDDLATGGIL